MGFLSNHPNRRQGAKVPTSTSPTKSLTKSLQGLPEPVGRSA